MTGIATIIAIFGFSIPLPALPAQDAPAAVSAPVADSPGDLLDAVEPEALDLPAEIIAPPEQDPEKLPFAGQDDDVVVAAALAYLEAINTLQGTFFQQAPSGTLSSGQFYIRRPGLLRFEYEPPNPLVVVANQGVVYVRDNDLKTTDSYPVDKTPLKFLLRKKIGVDEANILEVERAERAVGITLAATDVETEGDITLIFSTEEESDALSLVRWIVRDAQGALTIVDLIDVIQDEKLSNELFRIPETESPFLKNR